MLSGFDWYISSHTDGSTILTMQNEHLEQEETLGRQSTYIEKSASPPPPSRLSTLLKVALIALLAILLYQVAQRVFTVSAKQQDLRQLLTTYENALTALQKRLKQLTLTQEVPLTQEQHQQYQGLLKNIQDLEKLIEGGQHSEGEEDQPQSVLELMNQIETEITERAVMINTLVGHSKEEIRRKKVDIQDKIAKKGDFQQEKVRNPWALAKINLKTPYLDSLQKRHMEEEIVKEAERLEDRYRLSSIKQQLPICVIVTTHNNAVNYRYEYNLQSIVNQKYDNYKLVVIDDASTDGTPDLIDIFLKKSKLAKERYTLIRNQRRMTAVPNINKAIKQHCGSDDIAVLISGDDEILGKRVFMVLNAVYQTKKPGIAYTNHFFGHLHDEDFDKGYSRPYSFGDIKNRNYRFIGQHFGHMRTFLVSIFNQIKEEHMKYRNGTWIQATYDETFILPILQMSCDSIEYIDEYMYMYNYGTGDNDGEVNHDVQAEAAHYVRELPKYSCIPKYQKYQL